MSPLGASALLASALAAAAGGPPPGAPDVRFVELGRNGVITGGTPIGGRVEFRAERPFHGTFEARLSIDVARPTNVALDAMGQLWELLPRSARGRYLPGDLFVADLRLAGGARHVVQLRFPSTIPVGGEGVRMAWCVRDADGRQAASGTRVAVIERQRAWSPGLRRADDTGAAPAPAATLEGYPVFWGFTMLAEDDYTNLPPPARAVLMDAVALGMRLVLHGDDPRTRTSADDRLFAQDALAWRGPDGSEVREIAYGAGVLQVATAPLHRLPEAAQALLLQRPRLWSSAPRPMGSASIPAGRQRDSPPKPGPVIGIAVAALLLATARATFSGHPTRLTQGTALALPLACATVISFVPAPGRRLSSWSLVVDDGQEPGLSIEVSTLLGSGGRVDVRAKDPARLHLQGSRLDGSPLPLRVHDDGRGTLAIEPLGPEPLENRGIVVAAWEVVERPGIAEVDTRQGIVRTRDRVENAVLIGYGQRHTLGDVAPGTDIQIPETRDPTLEALRDAVDAAASTPAWQMINWVALGYTVAGRRPGSDRSTHILVPVQVRPARHVNLPAQADPCLLPVPEHLLHVWDAEGLVPEIPCAGSISGAVEDGFLHVACSDKPLARDARITLTRGAR